MIGDFFYAFIFEPLYNALIFLVSTVPYADVGIAVITLTIIVKFLLFPLSLKAVKTQLSMRLLEPKINQIKEKYKSNREEQAKKMMELYRTEGVNPFSSIATLLIQLPIIFGLYWILVKGGLPDINFDFLYAITPVPETLNMRFLWVEDISEGSIILALLSGVTQFFQIKLAMPEIKKRGANPSMKDDLARSFQLQMRYVMPVIVVGVAYVISAAIALYWTTSNLFAIGQELYMRRRLKGLRDSAYPASAKAVSESP